MNSTETSGVASRLREVMSLLLKGNASRYALLQRVWAVLSGPLSAFLILQFTTAIQQGYYYTFVSSASIVMFFELGFGTIIVQWLAHSWGDDVKSESLGTEEKLRNKNCQRIVRIARYWYMGAGILFALVGIPLAFVWLGGGPENIVDWLPAWGFYGAMIAVNLALAGSVAIGEGLGGVERVYRLRLIASICGTLALWAGLWLGAAYYALGLQQLAQALVTWLYVRPFSQACRGMPTTNWHELYAFWKTNLLPLQWRSALVVGSSFLLYQTTTLIAFKVLGPVEAGKIGFLMSISGMLGSLGLLLLAVNAVYMGRYAATKMWREFERFFRFYLWIGITLAIIAGIGFDVILTAGVNLQYVSEIRLTSQTTMWLIFTATLATTFAQAYIIRARCLRKEPFAAENMLSALIWPFWALWCAKHHGIVGLAGGYLLLMVFGLAVPIYLKHRRKEALWRRDLLAAA